MSISHVVVLLTNYGIYDKNSMAKSQETAILLYLACCYNYWSVMSSYNLYILEEIKTSVRVVAEMLTQKYCGEDWIGWVYLTLENDRWYSLQV